MLRASDQRMLTSLRLILLVLLMACASSWSEAQAQAGEPTLTPEKIQLTLKIKVLDKNTNRPIPDAEILISRSLKKGDGTIYLSNIHRTKNEDAEFVYEDGVLSRPGTDFLLQGGNHNLIVKAPKYNEMIVPLDDKALRKHKEDGKPIEVSLHVVEPTLTPSSTNPSTLENKEKGRLERLKIFFTSPDSYFNQGIWWLGLVFIILLAAITVAWWRFDRLLNFKAFFGAASNNAMTDNGSSKMLEEISENLTKIENATKRSVLDAEDIARLENTIKGAVKEEIMILEDRLINHPLLARPAALSIHSGHPEPPGVVSMRPQQPDSRAATSPQWRAKGFYQSLLNKEPLEPEPLYLENEGKSSMDGKLKDSSIYLSQSNNRQGTFVLFADGDKSGWVFPNPSLAYRKSALSEVFPDLTEEQFNYSKEQIEPVRASRVEDRRWKVEG